MNESQQTRKLCKQLEQTRGAMCYPLIGGRWSPKFWPDRLILHQLWFGFLEFKSANGKYSAGQIQVMKMIWQRAPARVYGVRILGPDEYQIELPGAKEFGSCKGNQLLEALNVRYAHDKFIEKLF